jgi:hypothetical protein
VEENALPTLIFMLRSEDAGIHYEAVGVIGNLVHSSVNIKKEVLSAGALQPVIGLLRCLMIHLFEFCINLIRHTLQLMSTSFYKC